MNIIIASSNKGKIEEIQRWLPNHNVVPYNEILGSFEIEETGQTFQENAIIKAEVIVQKLNEANYQKEYIVISDDSGLSVEALNNEPGLYSARYAGTDAKDADNNAKLITKLNENMIHFLFQMDMQIL